MTESLGFNRKIALLAGLFFGLQPAQVGAVAWIGGRTDSQACLFFVLMLFAIARHYRDSRWGWVVLGVVAGFCAMLTKEQVLPAVMVAPLAGLALKADRRRVLWSSVPYFAMGATFFALWSLGSPEHVKGTNATLAEIGSQISRSTLDYFLLLFVPNPSSMHTFSLESLRTPFVVGIGAILTLLIPYAVYRLWKQDARLGWLAIGALLVYLPVSNLIPIPSLVAAPYRVALCGPAVAIFLAVLASRIQKHQLTSALAMASGLAGFILVPWGAAQHANDVTLFGTCANYDSKSFYMRSNYIKALQDAGKVNEALRQSDLLLTQVYGNESWRDQRQALTAFRTDSGVNRRILNNHGARAEAPPILSLYFVMRGQLQMKLGQDAEAVRSLETATQIDRKDDSAYFGLGEMVLESQPNRGVKCLRLAMGLNPENPGPVYALGRYYAHKGQYESAYKTLVRIEKMTVDTGMPLLELADVEIKTGRYTAARHTLELASKKIVDRGRLRELQGQAFSS